MGFATVLSRAVLGLQALPVHVEVHLSRGLPKFAIVGLPETAVKESKDRVRSAILMSQFEFPSQRITVNLAPADMPKAGGCFDLAIAVGILLASDQLPKTVLKDFELLGELALSGELRPVSSCLPIAIAADTAKHALILPTANAEEAALVENSCVYPAKSLLEVCHFLSGTHPLAPFQSSLSNVQGVYPDLSEVKGQSYAKYCLEVVASGGHSVLLKGPPGSGKTMLASRLPGILPPLAPKQAYDTAVIFSMLNKLNPSCWQQRPFRAPHHGASAVALVGGGNPPMPGEISLAHQGVLFLDEFPEFQRHVLEMLREPLESGGISISRAGHQCHFPAQFQLIAAMNPCPCGYLGDPQKYCQCSSAQIARYQSKLSGPLLDRIDCHITVSRLALSDMDSEELSDSSDTVRQRVMACHHLQHTRQGKLNAQLTAKEIKTVCTLDKNTKNAFIRILETLNLSARVYHKTLKLARTIADMANKDHITLEDCQQALHFRAFEHNT